MDQIIVISAHSFQKKPPAINLETKLWQIFIK